MILNLSDKLHKAKTKAIEGHNTNWLDFGSRQSKDHARLVKTNSITIKNNNILEVELKVSTLEVKYLEETTTLQLASILDRESTLQDIEKTLLLS